MTGRVLAFLARTEVWVAGLALVAFLVLYWALRGAPIGQAAEEGDEDAPGAGYRDRVVAAVVAGLLLVVAGAYVALARSVPWSLPLFALGFGLVLTLIQVNRRHRHGSPTLRRTIAFADTVLTTTLLLGVLIVANVLAFKYGGPALDFTRERSFTLSSLTLNQLESLSRPVTFTTFFGESPRALRQADRVEQLLDLYKAANPGRIRLERVSYRDREEIESLIKRVPDVALTGGGVLIEYGEGEAADRVVVRNSDLFEGPRPGTPADPSAIDLPRRGRPDLGPDPAPRGEEVAGRLHERARRALAGRARPPEARARPLEVAADVDGLGDVRAEPPPRRDRPRDRAGDRRLAQDPVPGRGGREAEGVRRSRGAAPGDRRQCGEDRAGGVPQVVQRRDRPGPDRRSEVELQPSRAGRLRADRGGDPPPDRRLAGQSRRDPPLRGADPHPRRLRDRPAGQSSGARRLPSSARATSRGSRPT